MRQLELFNKEIQDYFEEQRAKRPKPPYRFPLNIMKRTFDPRRDRKNFEILESILGAVDPILASEENPETRRAKLIRIVKEADTCGVGVLPRTQYEKLNPEQLGKYLLALRERVASAAVASYGYQMTFPKL